MNTLTGTIVFSSGKEGDYDIWALDCASGELRQLTYGAGNNDKPRCSPAGDAVAYVSDKSGAQELWLMDADGSNQRQLTRSGKWHDAPSWDPEGKSLVFCANYDGNVDIYTMALDGTAPQRITDYPQMDSAPAFSPDGSKIVFTSRRSGNDDIWVFDRGSGALTRLTDYDDRDYTPRYSPDGSKIAWIRSNFLPDAAQGAKEDLNLWVMNADGTRQRRITLNAGVDRACAWSPDGTKLVYVSAGEGSTAERLSVIDLATEKTMRLPFNRAPMEAEIGAEPERKGIFSRRIFYPEAYFGRERNPDWTR